MLNMSQDVNISGQIIHTIGVIVENNVRCFLSKYFIVAK